MLSTETEYTGIAKEEPQADDRLDHRTTSSAQSLNLIKSWSDGKWKKSWDQTMKKTKHAPWKRLLGMTYFHAWPPLAMCVLVLGLILVATNDHYEQNESLCALDGTFIFDYQNPFSYVGGNYNPWAPSEFFQINLGFGKFSFASAKLIDVCWDLVCTC
jgi:hypothetical protein